jgi:hypothetical protein
MQMQKPDRYHQAETKGRDAYQAGKSLFDCPHGGRLGAMWRWGWSDEAAKANDIYAKAEG